MSHPRQIAHQDNCCKNDQFKVCIYTYEYNARVTYPKFWLDKALAALTAPEERKLPSELDNFTHSRLTSLVITSQPQYAFDLFWACSQLKEKIGGKVISFGQLKELALKVKIKAVRRRNPQFRMEGLPDDFLE